MNIIQFHRALFLTMAVAICLFTLPMAVDGEPVIAGHIIVRIALTANPQSVASDHGSSVLKRLSTIGIYSFAVPNGTTEAAFAALLAKDKRVVYTETDRLVTSPEVRGEPFHFAFDTSARARAYLQSPIFTQIHLGQLDLFSQSHASTPLATGAGIVVAVLDTGASFLHPDLAGHYVPGYNVFVPQAPPDEASDGVYNYEIGHGPMVAGIIARIAPKAVIMPIRVLNGDGIGSVENLISGVAYAVSHNARIINMSFGCTVKSSALNDVLDSAEAAGIVLVASAGNDNSSFATAPTVSRGTISVAALEADNTKSPYSDFGSFVSVSAPGTVQSTYWG